VFPGVGEGVGRRCDHAKDRIGWKNERVNEGKGGRRGRPEESGVCDGFCDSGDDIAVSIVHIDLSGAKKPSYVLVEELGAQCLIRT
jgi:hypothetical protein